MTGPSGADVPDQTSDDTDVGWGEIPADADSTESDAALRRLLDERPPHHGSV